MTETGLVDKHEMRFFPSPFGIWALEPDFSNLRVSIHNSYVPAFAAAAPGIPCRSSEECGPEVASLILPD